VDGYDKSQLRVGWGGDLHLRDLPLNVAALRRLDLPVAVISGTYFCCCCCCFLLFCCFLFLLLMLRYVVHTRTGVLKQTGRVVRKVRCRTQI
jgi:hypothetical protein